MNALTKAEQAQALAQVKELIAGGVTESMLRKLNPRQVGRLFWIKFGTRKFGHRHVGRDLSRFIEPIKSGTVATNRLRNFRGRR